MPTKIEFERGGDKIVEMSIKSGCVSVGKDISMLLNLEDMKNLVASLQKHIDEMEA